jgi:hypothetical protein
MTTATVEQAGWELRLSRQMGGASLYRIGRNPYCRHPRRRREKIWLVGLQVEENYIGFLCTECWAEYRTEMWR